ncbi:MAG: hypothetical protein IJY50_00235 [Clostridia bacterium]|nr:hypothetical protein [Clostridia bacterium]
MEKIKHPLFQKHYARLVTEAIIKSIIGGVLIGFCANFVAAAVAWFFEFGGIWLAIGVGLVAGIAGGVLLYFLKYRPDVHEVARRVDRLGLQERVVTMLEYQQDDSYIATLQRENAETKLKSVEHRKLRFRLPTALIVLAAVALVLGSGMTTVVGLAESEVIPSGSDLVNPEDPLAQYIAVTYEAGEGGEIEGETDQLLLPGEGTTPVVAVAEDGWMFIGWDDGNEDPERSESDVQLPITYTAIFQEVTEGGEEGEDGQQGGQDQGEGDKAEDLPEGSESNVENGDNGNGDKGSGSNSDNGESEGKGEGEEEGEGKGDGQGLGAGGKWQDSNQFIDGNTYYRDHLEMYYEMAQQIFSENGEIPPEMREFFETYFGGI